MTIKKLLIPLFLLLILHSTAQNIDNLEISPQDPITPVQEVSVIAENIFANSPCDLESVQVFQSSDTVFVETVHNMGLLTAICNSTDTVDLGTFAPGEYKVSYTLYYTGVNEILTFGDTAFAEFTVEAVNATEHKRGIDQIQIYPNPATDRLNIETSLRGSFAVYDAQGRQIKQIQINESPRSLPVDDLEPGIYFLAPNQGNLLRGTKFFVE